MLTETQMPSTKEAALEFIGSESQDIRLLGAWYFNEYPAFLREDDVQKALIALLNEVGQSIVTKVVVCEVLAQIPSCYNTIAPHLIEFLESADQDVVRSVTYSACIAGGIIVTEKVSAILGDEAYHYPHCRRVLASELLRLQGTGNQSIQLNARTFLKQAFQDGPAAIEIVDKVLLNGA